MTVFWIIILVAVLLVLLILTSVVIKINCTLDINGCRLESQIRVGGILFFRFDHNFPFSNVKTKETPPAHPKKLKSGDNTIILLSYFWQRSKQLLSAFSVQKFRWKTRIGTGDAALTGVLVGVSYALFGVIAKIMESRLTFLQPPELQVIPDFQENQLQMDLDCIVKTRLGQAIYAVARVVILLQRGKMRGKSSNSIADVHHT